MNDERPKASAAARARQLRKTWFRRYRSTPDPEGGDVDEPDDDSED